MRADTLRTSQVSRATGDAASRTLGGAWACGRSDDCQRRSCPGINGSDEAVRRTGGVSRPSLDDPAALVRPAGIPGQRKPAVARIRVRLLPLGNDAIGARGESSLLDANTERPVSGVVCRWAGSLGAPSAMPAFPALSPRVGSGPGAALAADSNLGNTNVPRAHGRRPRGRTSKPCHTNIPCARGPREDQIQEMTAANRASLRPQAPDLR